MWTDRIKNSIGQNVDQIATEPELSRNGAKGRDIYATVIFCPSE